MILAAASDTDRFGTLPITVGLVQTTAPGIGGVDQITTGTGDAIVFGGTQGDVIATDVLPDGSTSATPTNTNFIFGDDGYVTWVGTELNPQGLGGVTQSGWYGGDTNAGDIDAVVSTDTERRWRRHDHVRRPAGRSSSAARATTRSPAAPGRRSCSATAA